MCTLPGHGSPELSHCPHRTAPIPTPAVSLGPSPETSSQWKPIEFQDPELSATEGLGRGGGREATPAACTLSSESSPFLVGGAVARGTRSQGWGASQPLPRGRSPWASAGRLFSLQVPVPPQIFLSLVYKLEGASNVGVALELTTGDAGSCHVGSISTLNGEE